MGTAAAYRLACVACVTLAFGCEDGRQGADEPETIEEALPDVEPPEVEATEAEALGEAFVRVAERASEAVVSIRVEARQPGASQDRPSSPLPLPGPETPGPIIRGTGSGTVVRPDGYVLTNYHVVRGATRLDVVLPDGNELRGEVVGVDPPTDLAVVRVPAEGLTAATFADSSEAQVGEWVLAVGSPYGLDLTVTAGVISAVGRAGLGVAEIEDYLQTDASINPGNSGGPLVDMDARVLGINTMIVGPAQGIGFAVPSNLARRVASQIIATGEVRRPMIGITFQEVTPELGRALGLDEPRGAIVADVVPGGPAAEAGIEPGDVVVSVDGEPVDEAHELLRTVLSHEVGDRLVLGIVREGERLRRTVRLALRPVEEEPAAAKPSGEPRGAARFGLEVRPITPDLARRFAPGVGGGLLVGAVRPGSPADRAGLRPRDVIVEADRQDVRALADLASALEDGSALLRVRRGESAAYVVLSAE